MTRSDAGSQPAVKSPAIVGAFALAGGDEGEGDGELDGVTERAVGPLLVAGLGEPHDARQTTIPRPHVLDAHADMLRCIG
jgi:hypothetical protein